MLASTSYSVARIVSEAAYESEVAFNRVFKRESETPPARFRSQSKPAQAKLPRQENYGHPQDQMTHTLRTLHSINNGRTPPDEIPISANRSIPTASTTVSKSCAQASEDISFTSHHYDARRSERKRWCFVNSAIQCFQTGLFPS
jgi:hypothetical protein